MAQTDAEYIKLLTLYRKQDKEFVNNWLTTRMPTEMGRFGYFNTLAGVAGPYSQY